MPLYNMDHYESLTGQKIKKFSEAPLLASKVKKGDLPPIEKRLPENPLVMRPWDKIGTFGGTLRYSEDNPKFCHYLRHINEAELLELGPSDKYHHYTRIGGPIYPGIFEKWKSSEDGITHTFQIRKGLKWSDGVPVTTQDVLFTYEDVLMNAKIHPLLTNSEGSIIFLPEWEWVAWGGKQTKLVIIDDYSFSLVFGQPYPAFITQQVRSARWHMLLRPRHYLEQFHIRYTPIEKLKPLMEEMGYAMEEWGKFYFSIDPPIREAGYMLPANIPNIENYPTLDPWMHRSEYSLTEANLVRNPYYYKVDIEGNQLPYIDKIKRSVIKDMDEITDKIVSSQTDVQCNFVKLSDYPYLLENSNKGKYKVMLLKPWQGQMLVITINLCPYDGDIRHIVQDVKFRKALSLAIDREWIRDNIFIGYGRPAQATTSPNYEYYCEDFERAYVEYNPEKANNLLDEMGLNKRDKDGYRLQPNGQRLELLFAYFNVTPPAKEGAEAISNFWGEIGIYTPLMKLNDGGDFGKLQVTNKIIFSVWEMVGGDPLIPYHEGGLSDPVPLWWKWYETKGHEGVEPLLAAKELYKHRETIKTTRSYIERMQAAKEMYRLQAENLWILGTVTDAPQPFVFSDGLGNIESAKENNYYSSTVLRNAEQWYFIR